MNIVASFQCEWIRTGVDRCASIKGSILPLTFTRPNPASVGAEPLLLVNESSPTNDTTNVRL